MSDITRRISVNTSDNSGDDSTPLTPANSADNLPSNNETANEDPPRPERRMNRCWKYTGYAALAICAIWIANRRDTIRTPFEDMTHEPKPPVNYSSLINLKNLRENADRVIIGSGLIVFAIGLLVFACCYRAFLKQTVTSFNVCLHSICLAVYRILKPV
uniref:Transmembrane protein n=2 Tax=Panagrellus redivivus TaxID=6233 RepID=A0A7E4V7P8_PANRE